MDIVDEVEKTGLTATSMVLGVLALVLAIAVGVQTFRISSKEKAVTKAETALIKEKGDRAVDAANAAAKQLKTEQDYRAEDARREAARKTEIKNAQDKLAAAKADLVTANAASRKLSGRIANLVAQAREAAGDPTASPSSATTLDAVNVLADLLRRADARAGELAQVADQRAVALDACVGAYDSLTIDSSAESKSQQSH